MRVTALLGLLWLSAAPSAADPGTTQKGTRPPASHESLVLKAASLEAAATVALSDSSGQQGAVPAPFTSVDIEDPSGHAFDAFFASLARAKQKQGKARVVFYGDSHTAPDLITGRLRQGLQAEFGDGGPGFVLPGKPFPHHHHALVEYATVKGLTGERINRTVREGKFGLYGAALKAKRSVSIRMHTRRSGASSGQASELELYYLKQPGGGRVQLTVDGRPQTLVNTRAKGISSGYQRYHVAEGLHQLDLRTSDGPVTLLGLTLERKQAGVVVDMLGIPGARAKFHLLWDEELYAEQLKKRDPDLLVMAYGTNEAGDEDLSLSDYEQTLRKVLTRQRTLTPRASCLLLGPTDRPEKIVDGIVGQDASAASLAARGTRDGSASTGERARALSAKAHWAPRAAILSINAIQRKLAAEQGCGFVDVQAAMGGPMSIIRLAQVDPPYAARDFVHLTMRGYDALGDALFAALLKAYRAAGAAPAGR